MATATNLSKRSPSTDFPSRPSPSSGQGSFTRAELEGRRLGQAGFKYQLTIRQSLSRAELAVKIAERRSRSPPTGFLPTAAPSGARGPLSSPIASGLPRNRRRRSSADRGRRRLACPRRLGAEGACSPSMPRLRCRRSVISWSGAERPPERHAIAIFVTSDHGHSTSAKFISVGEAR